MRQANYGVDRSLALPVFKGDSPITVRLHFAKVLHSEGLFQRLQSSLSHALGKVGIGSLHLFI